MSLLDKLLTPKARVKLLVRYRRAESGYLLQNMINTWGLPGRVRSIPGGGFDIELEGRQKTLQEKIVLLGQNPIMTGGSIQTLWLAYTGQYNTLTISF